MQAKLSYTEISLNQLVAHYQILSPESIHISNIILTEQVLVRTIYVYMNAYMHVITISRKRGHEFDREGEWHVGGRKGEGEILSLNYNLK